MNRPQIRAELNAARASAERRLRGVVDPDERNALLHALDELDAAIQDIDSNDLLTAASVTANAADALSDAVSLSKPPFDLFVMKLLTSAQTLSGEVSLMQGSERLPQALLEQTSTPALAPIAVSAAPSGISVPAGSPSTNARAVAIASPNSVPIPINSTEFKDLQNEYDKFFASCRVNPNRKENVDFYIARLTKHKPTYVALGSRLGVPWYFIGIVHGMESGFDFSRHLHNGDPLTGRTKQHPAGHPKAGNPPFTWMESAADSLKLKNLDQVGAANWTLARVLYRLEAYNGFGYRPKGIPSPYLWSFSNIYLKGKFIADHKFDKNAVSQQCGAAVMLRALQEAELL